MWFNRNMWGNGSNLKGKYNQFAKVSCLNTYHIAVMWRLEVKHVPAVYKASAGREILHIFLPQTPLFFSL